MRAFKQMLQGWINRITSIVPIVSTFNIPFYVFITVFSSLLIFACMAGYAIQAPGLYYDEVLFVNAALGGQGELFIHSRLGKLPVMLMPYIGALKAWLFYPVFKFFGVTAFSIRWPVVLIGVLTLWINYALMKTAFSQSAAVIFIVLAAAEPSTLFHTRLDWGPTALMMLFRGTFLLSLFLWLKKGNHWMICVTILAMILGVFDKLNFIWFITAALCSLIMVYPDKILEFMRAAIKRRTSITLLAMLFICAVGLFFWSNHFVNLNREVGVSGWYSRWSYLINNMLRPTISGTAVYGFIIGDGGKMADKQLSVLGLSVVIAMLFFIANIRRFKYWRSIVFFCLFFIFTLVQIFFTHKATGPHHAVMLAPWWLIPIAVGLSQAFLLKGWIGVFSKGVAIAVIVISLFSSMAIGTAYLTGFQGHVRNPNWDNASYAMSHWLSEDEHRPIICADWGLGTVIHALSNGKANVHDRWPQFNDGFSDPEVKHFEAEFFEQKPFIIVRAEGKENFPQTRKNFFSTAEANNWKISRIVEIKGSDGTPLNEIFETTRLVENGN